MQFASSALRYSLVLIFVVACAIATAAAPVSAQQGATTAASLPDAPAPQAENSTDASKNAAVTLHQTPANILKDQAAIWTSPARLREQDLKWLIPLGLATAVAITADHQVMSSEVSHNAQFNHDNVLASDALTGVLIAVPAALIGKGQLGHDDSSKEAGILSGEALVDGLVVEQGMKLIFWRERPSMDNARGKFFQTSVGTDSSFPSSHTVLAWSSAAVLAAEYPAWWQQAGIYMMASGVSVTRVLGQQHFPSDVLVGSAA